MKSAYNYLHFRSNLFSNRISTRRKKRLNFIAPSVDSSELEVKRLLSTYVISSNQWAFKERLTYSIAPDGVYWYKGTNTIEMSLSEQLGPNWQTLVAEAFDTWSRAANVDICQVADQGGQGDYETLAQRATNFGDIRIGAYNFQEPTLYTLAVTTPPPPNGWTQAGDIQLNLDSNWPSQGTYDLLTVFTHEIGHALGLDHPTDPSSIMYPIYQGVRHELGSGDIQGIQLIYGPRIEDRFTKSGLGLGVDSAIAIATPKLGQSFSALTDVRLAATGAADYFKLTVPDGFVGNSLQIEVSAAGLSMLAPEVVLVNSEGQAVKTVSDFGHWGGTVRLDLGKVSPGQSFTFRVQSAESGRFDIGSYQVNAVYAGGVVPQVPPPVTVAPVPAPVPPVSVAVPPPAVSTTPAFTPVITAPVTVVPVVPMPVAQVPVVTAPRVATRIPIQRIRLTLPARRQPKAVPKVLRTAQRPALSRPRVVQQVKPVR